MVADQIAAARQASGLSIEDLARRTRIPASRLKALEAGAYELLPAPIYSRGYVRACAIELKLDPDALVRRFDSERPLPPAPPLPSSSNSYVEAGEVPDAQRVRGVLMIAGGIALVIFLIWSGREPAGNAVEHTALAPEASTGAPERPAPVATTGEQAPVSSGAVSIALTAERECWVAANADGRRVIYRLMQPGEKATIEAQQGVTLRAGDAGALTISVNGEAPHAFGGDGEVRTATFGT
jgi:cytoskeletal protein RodZ